MVDQTKHFATLIERGYVMFAPHDARESWKRATREGEGYHLRPDLALAQDIFLSPHWAQHQRASTEGLEDSLGDV